MRDVRLVLSPLRDWAKTPADKPLALTKAFAAGGVAGALKGIGGKR